MKTLSFTAKQLRELAEEHVRMFERRIQSGSPNVRVSECERYLGIWLDLQDSIRNADDSDRIEVDDLAPNERSEVIDAYACGDYEKILGDPP